MKLLLALFFLTSTSLAVDVSAFGAFPNDGIDDTAAIQEALDTPDALVTFEAEGTYTISSRLTSAVPRRTIQGRSTNVIVQQTASGIGALLIQANEVTVRNLTFVGVGIVAPDPEDEEDEFQDGHGVGLQVNEHPNYINDFSAERVRVLGFAVGVKNVYADASRLVKCSIGPNGKNLVVLGNQDAMLIDNCTSGAHTIVNCEVQTNGAAKVVTGVWNGNGMGRHAFRLRPGGELTLDGVHVEGLDATTLAVDGGSNSHLHCYSARFRDADPNRLHITGGSGFSARLFATIANVAGTGNADFRAFGSDVPLTWNGMNTRADECVVVSDDPSNIPAPSVDHAGRKIRILSAVGSNVLERVIECRKTGAAGGVDVYQWIDL